MKFYMNSDGQKLEVMTFDELVRYGLEVSSNVVDGMPWSFNSPWGHPVTHENNDCYYVGDFRFERGELLIYQAEDKTIFLNTDPSVFYATHTEITPAVVYAPHAKFVSAPAATDTGVIRQFSTGATRDTAEDKLDYEGFLSPTVLRRYAEYLHKHRVQSDGTLRDSDNWQKGIPFDVYMKSLFRHFMEVWAIHRNNPASEDLEEALCGVIFNSMGYLFEHLKKENK